MFSSEPEKFFEYALELFSRTGHTDISAPEFFNHSARRFVYFDNEKNLSLNFQQRDKLNDFDNVSRLFTAYGIAFFSANLLTSLSDRSQTAHDVHALMHTVSDNVATICLFRHANEIILSFAFDGLGCLLSDWYAPDDEDFTERLNVANFSVIDGNEYFCDLVNFFARAYYFLNSTPTAYSILPIDLFSGNEEVSREEIEDFIMEQKFSAVKEYGNDYIECDAAQLDSFDDTPDELDSVLLEAEEVEFVFEGEEASVNDDDIPEELSEIDEEIFDDPSRLLEYLEKNSPQSEGWKRNCRADFRRNLYS